MTLEKHSLVKSLVISVTIFTLVFLLMLTLWSAPSATHRSFKSLFERRQQDAERIDQQVNPDFRQEWISLRSSPFDYYVDNSIRSYTDALSLFFNDIGSSKVQLVPNPLIAAQRAADEMVAELLAFDDYELPIFCSEMFGLRCSMMVHFDDSPTRMIVIAQDHGQQWDENSNQEYVPTSTPMVNMDVDYQMDEISNQGYVPNTTPRVDVDVDYQMDENSNHINEPSTPVVMVDEAFGKEAPSPKYLPIVQTGLANSSTIVKKHSGEEAMFLPHFCPHVSTTMPLAGTKPGRSMALFPSQVESFTNYFLDKMNEITDALDVAFTIQHLHEIYNESGTISKLSDSIYGVVFIETNLPEEVLNFFYCQNIPVFLTAFDLKQILLSGTEEEKAAVTHCDDLSSVRPEFKTNMEKYRAFPQVVTYSCYDDLLEKAADLNLPALTLKMWEENFAEMNKMKKYFSTLKGNI